MSCGLVSRIQAQVRGTNGRSLEDTVDPIIRMVAVGRLYVPTDTATVVSGIGYLKALQFPGTSKANREAAFVDWGTQAKWAAHLYPFPRGLKLKV